MKASSSDSSFFIKSMNFMFYEKQPSILWLKETTIFFITFNCLSLLKKENVAAMKKELYCQPTFCLLPNSISLDIIEPLQDQIDIQRNFNTHIPVVMSTNLVFWGL